MAGAALALALAAGPASAAPVVGPPGDEFYAPPAASVAGEPGSLVWTRPATPLTTVAAAASTTVVIYRSTTLTGAPTVVSGTVLLPPGDAPAGGWPVVAWGHVTTGAADRCAPSRATAGDPELSRMLRGDRMAASLLQAGFAVARTDYEGLGTPGPHPYLIGRSLARSTVDIVRAARELDARVGRRWVAAGHSEGGVAALFSGALGQAMAPELELLGAAAVAPALRTRTLFELGRKVPPGIPGLGVLSALGSIVLTGAAVEDPALGPLYRQGALSQRALGLLSHTEERCLEDLSYADSWGGLSPSLIAGPPSALQAEGLQRFARVLDRNDPANLRFPRSLPVRLDQGDRDPVTLRLFADELVVRQFLRGKRITYRTYPRATHQTITDPDQAVGPLTRWIKERLQ